MKMNKIHATLVLLCNSGKSLHVTQQTLNRGQIFWSGTQQALSLIKILNPPGKISLSHRKTHDGFYLSSIIIKLDSVFALKSL